MPAQTLLDDRPDPDCLLARARQNFRETEPRPFLGDLGCGAELNGLADASVPALTHADGRYALTKFGRDLLAGDSDWLDLNGIDRWIGGVHLDSRKRTLCDMNASCRRVREARPDTS